jgi:hypothetical protein
MSLEINYTDIANNAPEQRVPGKPAQAPMGHMSPFLPPLN